MTSFKSLGLSGDLVNAVSALGFETPTPIQEKAIPVLLNGEEDLIALAQTGTGKTAAFGLPLIELLDEKDFHAQALIVAPTRELCVQITNDLINYCKKVKSLNIVAVYGGASISEQIKKIKRGAHIVVATPGRLMDLMDRKAVNIGTVRYVVLDEADEMLNMGFQEDVNFILSHTPKEKKIWLFSATMPSEVRQIANKYMFQPHEITIGTKNKGNENISHYYTLVEDRDRYEALKRYVDYSTDIFGLIFCRTKIDTQNIAEKLIRDGYNADALHGDLSQGQRDTVMKSFREKTLQLLVATDVAARGIDVSNITHVIHYHLPDELEYYTHRSGRTARAGKEGVSIALVSRKELFRLKQIEKSLHKQFEKKLIPTGAEVCEKRLLALVHRLRGVQINEEEIAGFLPSVYAELMDLDKEEIIKRFTSLEFNHFLDYYRGARDLNKSDKDDYSAKGRPERYASGNRLFVSLGKMDGLEPGKLLALICERSGISGKQVGRIEMKGAYSFFEVDEASTEKVQQSLNGIEFRGRIVRIEMTGSSGAPPNKKENRNRKDFDRKRSSGRKRY